MFTTKEQNVLLMHPNPTVKEKLVADKVAFWKDFVPTLQRKAPTLDEPKRQGLYKRQIYTT
jgi:hypothetical protein